MSKRPFNAIFCLIMNSNFIRLYIWSVLHFYKLTAFFGHIALLVNAYMTKWAQ